MKKCIFLLLCLIYGFIFVPLQGDFKFQVFGYK